MIRKTFFKLKEIYDFINVKISDRDLKNIIDLHDFKNIPKSARGIGKFNRSAKIEGWKTNFSEKEKKTMNRLMGDTLEKLGYVV